MYISKRELHRIGGLIQSIADGERVDMDKESRELTSAFLKSLGFTVYLSEHYPTFNLEDPSYSISAR